MRLNAKGRSMLNQAMIPSLDVHLTPAQLAERAAKRQAGARLLPPGKVREWVVQEVQRARDRALAEINQSL